DVQVRNRGTIGGSLVHADPAADWPAVFLALDGEAIAAGAKGERQIPAAQFFTGRLASAVKRGEVLTEGPPPRDPKRPGRGAHEAGPDCVGLRGGGRRGRRAARPPGPDRARRRRRHRREPGAVPRRGAREAARRPDSGPGEPRQTVRAHRGGRSDGGPPRVVG